MRQRKIALKLSLITKQSELLDAMNKKPRAIITEDQCIQRDANPISSSTMLTETVQITLYMPQINSPNLTTNIQGTTIKTDINK